MNENNTRGKERPRSSILDFNLSWPLMIVYIGYLVGIYFAQQSTYGRLSGVNERAYFLISFFAGLILTAIIYNVFKAIAARIAGYRVLYFGILGFFFDHSGKKKKVSYDFTKITDVTMRFVPIHDDVNKNPTAIFWGGTIGEVVLIALAAVLFLTLSIGKSGVSEAIGWGSVFAVAYGFVIYLYEMIPLRQDYATDSFNLMKTRNKEDKQAFNIIYINKEKEMQGEDFLPVPDYTKTSDETNPEASKGNALTENYDSYYKAQLLYYIYLDHLYASRLEQAVKVLDAMKYLAVDFPEDKRYLAQSEYIYLRYLIDDEAGADKAFMAMKSDDKSYIRKPTLLSTYRCTLFVAGFISQDKEKVNSVISSFNNKVSSYPEPHSHRVEKEKSLFEEAQKKLAEKRPQVFSEKK